MAKECMKNNQNIYFHARKNAALYDKNLNSREKTAELIGISVSALSDYELGITKVVPPENVDIMAKLYNCPELRTKYCKEQCPLGKHIEVATSISNLEGIALRMVNEFDIDRIRELIKNIVAVAADGVITSDEKLTVKNILVQLDKISLAISEMKLIGEKALNK